MSIARTPNFPIPGRSKRRSFIARCLPLSPIGDIAGATLTENTTAETITWSTQTEWINGTQSDTQANQGTSDVDDQLVNLLLNDQTNLSTISGVQANTGGMGQYPAGDGGNGSLFMVSDSNSNLFEVDKNGNQLQSASTDDSGPRDATYFAPTDTLWQSGSDNGRIYEWNPDDLSQGNSTVTNPPGSGSSAGITSDSDTYLWYHRDSNIYKVEESDPTTEVTSFGTPTGTVADSNGSLGWNGQYVLYREAGTVYTLDPDDGTQINTFSVPSSDKHSGITRAYGEWYLSDRNSGSFKSATLNYAGSGTHTTTTKSFSSNVAPDLQNLDYSLNSQSIVLDVIGSPGTASEEIVSQTLDGSTSYSLSWSNSHTDFRIRPEFSTTDLTTSPTFDRGELVS